MIRYQGRLERQDLGPGVWILAGIQRWVLRGKVPAELLGKWVEVEGEPEGGFGVEMAGPVLRVGSIRSV